MVEYGYKVELFQINGIWTELKGIKSLSLNSSLNSFYDTLKVMINIKSLLKDYIDKEVIRLTLYRDGVKKTRLFYLTDIVAVDKDYKDLVCKSGGYKLDELKRDSSYTGALKHSLADVLKGVCPYECKSQVELNAYERAGAKAAELVRALCDRAGVSYYLLDGVLLFDDEFYIKEDDKAVVEFTEQNCSSITVNSSKLGSFGAVEFNNTSGDNLYSTPKITLAIDPSPQPISPSQNLYFKSEDGNTTYTIHPITALARVYYSPLHQAPLANFDAKKIENYGVVEEYELEDDDSIALNGGVKDSSLTLELDGTQIEPIKVVDNVAVFKERLKGKLKVAYKTDILRAVFSPSLAPKRLNLELEHLGQSINYTHEYELNGYYPLPYTHQLSLIKEWNADPSLVAGATVRIGSQSYAANAFGEVALIFQDYGNYALEVSLNDGSKLALLKIAYFANEFKVGF